MIEFSELKEFVSNYWRYNPSKITENTTLDDIGMYGADKYDFLIDLSKKYDMDMTNFPFGKYVDDEIVDPFGLRDLLFKLLRKEIRKIEPLKMKYIIFLIEKFKK